jgi:hypothetical protein
MMAQRNGPLLNRAGFSEKFADELQVGNSTESGSDFDSLSVASDDSDENEQTSRYVPLETPCTPWMVTAPRGVFGTSAKEARTVEQKSVANSSQRGIPLDALNEAAPPHEFQGIGLLREEQGYGRMPQGYGQGSPSTVQASKSMQQQAMQQAMQQQMLQQQLQQQMQQMQQQNSRDQQMQQMMMQWMNSMSPLMTIPVPVPVPMNLSQQPQMQVPFGYQLVRKEKPMLEDLLPGQTRGVRRRTTRPKRAESQIGGSSASKVFVGGLSPHSTAETLRAHFEKFGVITDCAVINEPGTRKSRGFGFVEFAGGIPAGLLDQEHIVGQRRCGVRAYEYSAQDEVTENVEAA